jgi:hypothetical protein
MCKGQRERRIPHQHGPGRVAGIGPDRPAGRSTSRPIISTM